MTRDFDPWEQDGPDRDDNPVAELPTDDDYNEAEATFYRHVAAEAHQLRVREAARNLVAAEQAGEAPPFDYGTLTEILTRPPEPPFRVDELIPSDASTLVVAQRKTGKTTFDLNLANSLLTGVPFLGRFDVIPIDGNVAILNYEVSARQIAQWAYDVGIPPERLILVNLRGRRNPLGNAEDRAQLAGTLRKDEVEALIVDPFGRAYTGASQNDNGEVGTWLTTLDHFTRTEVGASDLVLSVHAGWDGERSRGASALEDWADTIVTLTRNTHDEDDEARYMKATGRDVDIEEDCLSYDPVTRLLTVTGSGSRRATAKTRQHEGLLDLVLQVVADNPGITGYGMNEPLRELGANFQRGEPAEAARLGIERGLIRCEDGPRKSKMYHLIPNLGDDLPDLPATFPGEGHPTFPTSPIGGRDGGGGQGTSPSPTGRCDVCSQPLHDLLIAAGETIHPFCTPEDVA